MQMVNSKKMRIAQAAEQPRKILEVVHGNSDSRRLERLLSHPAKEKLHFYVRNAFRAMRFGDASSHLLMLLLEKKVHPVFNRYVLLPGDLVPVSGEAIEIRSIEAFENLTPAALAVLYAQSTYSTFSWLRECLRKGSTLWLAYLDGTLVAYCCTRRFYPDPARQYDSYLFALETLTTFRGRNVGYGFLRGLCATLFSQGAPQVWSETHVWNRPSNRLHQRLGFKFREKLRVVVRP